jgi:hypothetical protein
MNIYRLDTPVSQVLENIRFLLSQNEDDFPDIAIRSTINFNTLIHKDLVIVLEGCTLRDMIEMTHLADITKLTCTGKDALKVIACEKLEDGSYSDGRFIELHSTNGSLPFNLKMEEYMKDDDTDSEIDEIDFNELVNSLPEPLKFDESSSKPSLKNLVDIDSRLPPAPDPVADSADSADASEAPDDVIVSSDED